MKKIFTIVMAVFAIYAVNAQVQLQESFTNGIPSTWTVLDVNDNGNSWISVDQIFQDMGYDAGVAGPVFAYGEEGDCASSWSYYPSSYTSSGFYGTSEEVDNWLITPSFTAASNSELTFYARNLNGTDYPDELMVKVSNGGTTTADFTTTIMPLTAPGSDWELKILDLSAFAGQTIRIAFVHQATDMLGMFLDEVRVGNPTGITEAEASQFSIYPNPAYNVLNVAGEGNAEICNLLGQTIMSEAVNGEAQINISNLEAGVYFVRMNGATHKFIKK